MSTLKQHLSNQGLPTGVIDEDASLQALIKRPVGAGRLGAADSWVLQHPDNGPTQLTGKEKA